MVEMGTELLILFFVGLPSPLCWGFKAAGRQGTVELKVSAPPKVKHFFFWLALHKRC
jgi:hypothetical protein